MKHVSEMTPEEYRTGLAELIRRGDRPPSRAPVQAAQPMAEAEPGTRTGTTSQTITAPKPAAMTGAKHASEMTPQEYAAGLAALGVRRR
jgi:cell division septation protein DedD